MLLKTPSYYQNSMHPCAVPLPIHHRYATMLVETFYSMIRLTTG